MENIVRHRYWWFALSLLIILPGLFFLLIQPVISEGQFRLGLRPSIDFAGGALWDIQFPDSQREELNTEEIAQLFVQQGFEGALVQLSEVTVGGKTIPAALVRTKALSLTNPEEQQQQMLAALKAKY